MPRAKASAAAGGPCKGVKRIKTEDSQTFQEDKTWKPIYNKDVPSNADMVNMIVISEDDPLDADTYFAVAKKDYGDVLQYDLPSCPQVCDTQILPNTMINTNHIYDVDVEVTLKNPEPVKKPVVFEPAPKSDTRTPGSTQVAKNSGDLTWFSRNIVGTQALGVSVAAAAWKQFTTKRIPFCIYVLSKQKQKELGDWIAEYSKDTNAPVRKRLGGIEGLTPWLFDRFCYEVKPMFAKYFYWQSDSRQFIYEGVFAGDANADTDNANLPMPGESPRENGGKWFSREFHRRMDESNLTPSDSYANKLLVGTLGSYFNQAQYVGLKVYYKPTKVNAQTLYFQENQQFQLPAYRGSRFEYGKYVDWYEDKVTDKDSKLIELEDATFRGVITANQGKLAYLANGKKNGTDDATNILQDTATGTWY